MIRLLRVGSQDPIAAAQAAARRDKTLVISHHSVDHKNIIVTIIVIFEIEIVCVCVRLEYT
jgi:hypothetical protein